jgi:hypothetical protein
LTSAFAAMSAATAAKCPLLAATCSAVWHCRIEPPSQRGVAGQRLSNLNPHLLLTPFLASICAFGRRFLNTTPTPTFLQIRKPPYASMRARTPTRRGVRLTFCRGETSQSMRLASSPMPPIPPPVSTARDLPPPGAPSPPPSSSKIHTHVSAHTHTHTQWHTYWLRAVSAKISGFEKRQEWAGRGWIGEHKADGFPTRVPVQNIGWRLA